MIAVELFKISLDYRQGDSRKIAVSGYLQVLKHFQVYGSLPASQQSSQGFSGSSQVIWVEDVLKNNKNCMCEKRVKFLF